MKIALLISGCINSTKETYENIHKNVVKSNEVDFFIICEKKNRRRNNETSIRII